MIQVIFIIIRSGTRGVASIDSLNILAQLENAPIS